MKAILNTSLVCSATSLLGLFGLLVMGDGPEGKLHTGLMVAVGVSFAGWLCLGLWARRRLRAPPDGTTGMPTHLRTGVVIGGVTYVLLVLSRGCVPVPGGFFAFDPHTTPRLLPFDGTILDERTHAPIAGAKIFLTAHPEVAYKSDSSGHFEFKEVHNWHYGSVGNAGGSEDLPPGEHWDYDATIVHTNYIPRQAGFYALSDHVVLLKKLGEPSGPHPWLLFNGSGEILRDMGAGQYLRPGGIRIIAHYNGGTDTEPSALHIGFVRRVYDPQVATVNSPDKASIAFPERKEFDWDFRIEYAWDPNTRSRFSDAKDSSRVYRLELTP